MLKSIIKNNNIDGDDYWISVSDLMAGLMVVFLFIMVIYARTSDQRLQTAQEIITEWRDTEYAIYLALKDEFESDLERWNAIIERESLTIRFLSPDILFKKGEADLSPEFKIILEDFMPRYIGLLADQFSEAVDEVKIEGHTSSEWNNSLSDNEAFIKNMSLSQARTRSVLEYSLAISYIQELTPWMIKTVSANGMSSARLIHNTNGDEDKRLSKRVEFRIKTKSQEAMFKLIENIAPGVRKAFR